MISTIHTMTRFVEVLLFAGLLAVGYLSTPVPGLSEESCRKDTCPGTPSGQSCVVNDCNGNEFCECGAYGPYCGCYFSGG